mgnify:CR=1 FL=1
MLTYIRNGTTNANVAFKSNIIFNELFSAFDSFFPKAAPHSPQDHKYVLGRVPYVDMCKEFKAEHPGYKSGMDVYLLVPFLADNKLCFKTAGGKSSVIFHLDRGHKLPFHRTGGEKDVTKRFD